MKWFGVPHGAPYEADCERVAAPVGRPCARCGEAIGWHEDGLLIPHLGPEGGGDLPYHYECHFRGLVGGLNHLKGVCTCCGGIEPPDPPEMSRREAARAATAYWLSAWSSAAALDGENGEGQHTGKNDANRRG